MRDTEVATQYGKTCRVLDRGDRFRPVAEHAPASRDGRENMRPVLEPGAADRAARRIRGGKALEGLHEFKFRDAVPEVAAEADMGLRRGQRILVAEEIRDQREISAAARGYGQCPPGRGSNQDGRATH